MPPAINQGHGGIMQANSFRLVTTGSIIGLVSILSLTTAKASSDNITWWHTEQEKLQAESAKAIADAYKKNQIANFDQLIVSDYTLGQNPPRINWQHSVNPARKTFIYDRYRKCVGYALKGKFYFTVYYKGVCD
jgi:hypothetical protein